MDIATLIGIVAGLGVIGAAIFLGGDFGSFVNVPSILVVFGGTAAATLIKFPLKEVMTSFKTGASIAFKNTTINPQAIYDQAIEMSGIVRKNGLLGLENYKIDNQLMARGIRLCTDGHNLDIVKDTLAREVNLSIQRDEVGETMFRGIGDTAPAFGMIGTLVGLVQMLSALDDPASIGPAMAIAMLTTLYGAIIANLIALPIADKLALKVNADRTSKDLILQTVIQIHGNQSPTVLTEVLAGYLPAGSGKESKGKKKK